MKAGYWSNDTGQKASMDRLLAFLSQTERLVLNCNSSKGLPHSWKLLLKLVNREGHFSLHHLFHIPILSWWRQIANMLHTDISLWCWSTPAEEMHVRQGLRISLAVPAERTVAARMCSYCTFGSGCCLLMDNTALTYLLNWPLPCETQLQPSEACLTPSVHFCADYSSHWFHNGKKTQTAAKNGLKTFTGGRKRKTRITNGLKISQWKELPEECVPTCFKYHNDKRRRWE